VINKIPNIARGGFEHPGRNTPLLSIQFSPCSAPETQRTTIPERNPPPHNLILDLVMHRIIYNPPLNVTATVLMFTVKLSLEELRVSLSADTTTSEVTTHPGN